MKHSITNLLITLALVAGCLPASSSAAENSVPEAMNAAETSPSNPPTLVSGEQSPALIAQEDDVKLREGIVQPKEASGTDTTRSTGAKTQTPAPRSAAAHPTISSDVTWPERLSSFACCSVLGVPICMVRRFYYETRNGARDLVGEHKNPASMAAASALSLPYAAVGAILEGVPYSILHSWRGSAVEPFGKEAFSLGEGEN